MSNISDAILFAHSHMMFLSHSWRNTKVNIGIIGESGSGKSTLINALRGLYPNDDGIARVDVKECTKKPTPYVYPENENITLWDLPGVNTPNFPINTYLENVRMSNG